MTNKSEHPFLKSLYENFKHTTLMWGMNCSKFFFFFSFVFPPIEEGKGKSTAFHFFVSIYTHFIVNNQLFLRMFVIQGETSI